MDSIQEGDYVVLMKSFNVDNTKIISVEPGNRIHYGKLHFDPKALIGTPYGTVFEINDYSMTRVEDFEAYDNELSAEFSSNVSNFSEKSQFSQEKIIRKKKQKRRANIVTAIRPSLLLINEMFFSRDKIGGIRPDILSQILTSSNIQTGSRCLVLDHNLGIISAAIMSRVLPNGLCIQIAPDYEFITTTRKTLKMLNIKDHHMKDRIMGLSIKDFYKICRNVDRFSYEHKIHMARTEDHRDRLSQLPDRAIKTSDTGQKVQLSDGSTSIDEDRSENLQQVLMKKDSNRDIRHKERISASKILKSKSINSLILVAQNDHPVAILKLAYPFLMLSGQIVIYSDTIEPLLDCHQYLKTNSLAVSLNVSESWLRKYQVLPDRTRPDMNMLGFGGYILTGTKASFA